jgi:hypothetical protein
MARAVSHSGISIWPSRLDWRSDATHKAATRGSRTWLSRNSRHGTGYGRPEWKRRSGEAAVRTALRGLMTCVSECAMLTIALAALAQPVLARTHLNCPTRKIVLISAPTGDTSSATEETLSFWVDDEAKTLTFRDNRPLTVTRLDQFWISANRDGIFYEFDRRDGALSYASSTTKNGVSTTIIGLGRCEALPN